jgi:hypothetical protein
MKLWSLWLALMEESHDGQTFSFEGIAQHFYVKDIRSM